MTEIKKPRLKRDWVGRHIELLREIETNAGTILAVGEIMQVTQNRGGLHLQAIIQCDHCGCRNNRKVTKLHESNVRLLPPSYVPVKP